MSSRSVRALRVWCVVALCALWLHAVCEAGAARVVLAARAKQPRSPRKFTNTESLATGRTFGKRAQLTKSDFLGYDSADNFLDFLENPQDRTILDQPGDKIVESLPVDWFVNEMIENPELARTIVRKFIDANQDGYLSTDELLRNNF